MGAVNSNENFDVIPTRLAVKAMRDSGYKNAAYALAELVDNSVQAKAKCVEILCKEEDEFVTQRVRRRVKQIAVVDDGCGMSDEVLRRALQFGNGERLNDRSGIGRFGMGLPNSSISQARKVEVWSWQSGYRSAVYSYLDIDEIERGEQRDVPMPTAASVPTEWVKASDSIDSSRSGTLVVWSKVDKCDWKTAKAIFSNSELTIGRIYRYFIKNERVRIRLASILSGGIDIDSNVRPNDPLYLMEGTSTPAPWDVTPLFDLYGKPFEVPCEFNGVLHTIKMTMSVAKPEARTGHNPGARDYGTHARNNIGVSVIRAGRELELQKEWCIGYDPVERFWGIEIDFPPALDEVFGVPNNKQGASALSVFATSQVIQIAEREGYRTEQELRDAWDADNDPRKALLQIKTSIESNLSEIRSALRAQTARSESKRRHQPDANSAESRGKQAAQLRADDGHRGGSDAVVNVSPEEKATQISGYVQTVGLPKEEAVPFGAAVVEEKFAFFEVDLHSAEFFTVTVKAGTILIGLNTSHPAYRHLIALLKHGEDSDDVATLKLRLHQSYEGLKLLLESWARYEDELSDGIRRERAQEARLDWGRVARDFFRNE